MFGQGHYEYFRYRAVAAGVAFRCCGGVGDAAGMKIFIKSSSQELCSNARCKEEISPFNLQWFRLGPYFLNPCSVCSSGTS